MAPEGGTICSLPITPTKVGPVSALVPGTPRAPHCSDSWRWMGTSWSRGAESSLWEVTDTGIEGVTGEKQRGYSRAPTLPSKLR